MKHYLILFRDTLAYGFFFFCNIILRHSRDYTIYIHSSMTFLCPLTLIFRRFEFYILFGHLFACSWVLIMSVNTLDSIFAPKIFVVFVKYFLFILRAGTWSPSRSWPSFLPRQVQREGTSNNTKGDIS